MEGKIVKGLRSMNGYSDEEMEMVFVRLHANRNLVEAFYLKKPSLGKRCIDYFIAS